MIFSLKKLHLDFRGFPTYSGIYDPFDAPILLKSSELSMAREIVAMDYRGFDSATAYKICALAATPADPESTTTFEAYPGCGLVVALEHAFSCIFPLLMTCMQLHT